jgi:nitrite reductase (NO-forming)
MRRFAPRALILLLIAVLSIGFLAACGDDDNGSADQTTEATTAATTPAPPADTTDTSGAAPSGGPTVLNLEADPAMLAFKETELTAPAGEITLKMTNPSSIPHDIAMDEPTEVTGDVVQDGGVSEITVNLPAGTYEYYCSVPGHEAAGMKGTLTVR